MAGRPGEAEGLLDPRLEGSDEITLWRGVRLAMLQEDSQAAATIFAATSALILTYPPAMQQKLLPLALETMVAGGEAKAAAPLLAQRPNDPTLALARGMLAEANGATELALATYDALAAGHDRLARARAAPRAVALRLATGRLTPKQAAGALDSLLYAWRGDRRELDLRERVAALRAQSGAVRQALALLRESAVDFPDDRAEIRGRMSALFADFLRADAAKSLPAIELVALVDENADLLATGPADIALESALADRLVSLDLPRQAEQVLAKVAAAAPEGAERARLGARLASLRLREGDAGGTLKALADTDGSAIPSDVAEQRLLLFAEASARQGKRDEAVAALRQLDTPAAREALAGIFELSQNWADAERALTDCIAKTIPPSGMLDEAARRQLVRLATDIERAGDEPAMAALRMRFEPRLGSGETADMFRLLTARPIGGIADLKRTAQEASLARSVAQAPLAVPPVTADAR